MNTSLSQNLNSFLQQIDSNAQIGACLTEIPSAETLKERVSEIAAQSALFSSEEVMKIAANLTALEERVIATYHSLSKEEKKKKTQEIQTLFDECIGILGEVINSKTTNGKQEPRYLLNLAIVMSRTSFDNGAMASSISIFFKDHLTLLVSQNLIANWMKQNPNWLKFQGDSLNHYHLFWQKENGFILFLSKKENNLNLTDLGFNLENFEEISIRDMEERLKDKEPKEFICKLRELKSCLSSSNKVKRNILLTGHGNKTLIANLTRPDYQEFLTFLENENTICLSIDSCFAGEMNKFYIPRLKNKSKQVNFPIAIFGLGGTITSFNLLSFKDYFDSLYGFFQSKTPKTHRTIKPILKPFQEMIPANAKIIVRFPSKFSGKAGFRAIQSNMSALTLIEIRKTMSQPGRTIEIANGTRQILFYLKDNPVKIHIPFSDPPQLTSMIAGPAFHYIDSISTTASFKQLVTNTLLAHKEHSSWMHSIESMSNLQTSKAFLIGKIDAGDGTFTQVMITALQTDNKNSSTKVFYATENQEEKSYHGDIYDLNLATKKSEQSSLPEERFWKREVISPLEFAAHWVAIEQNLKPNNKALSEAGLEQHREGRWDENSIPSFWKEEEPLTIPFLKNIVCKGELTSSNLEKLSTPLSGRELSCILELIKNSSRDVKNRIEDFIKLQVTTLTAKEKYNFHFHRIKQGDFSFLESLFEEENVDESTWIALIEAAFEQKNLEALSKLFLQVSLKNLPDGLINAIFQENLITFRDLFEANPREGGRQIKKLIKTRNEDRLIKILEEINFSSLCSEIFEALIDFSWQATPPSSLIKEAIVRFGEKGCISKDAGQQLQFILKSLEQGDDLLWRQFIIKSSHELKEEETTSLRQFSNACQRFYKIFTPWSMVYEELAGEWYAHLESLKKEVRALYSLNQKEKPDLETYQKLFNTFNPAICCLFSFIIESGTAQQIEFLADYILPEYLPEPLKISQFSKNK